MPTISGTDGDTTGLPVIVTPGDPSMVSRLRRMFSTIIGTNPGGAFDDFSAIDGSLGWYQNAVTATQGTDLACLTGTLKLTIAAGQGHLYYPYIGGNFGEVSKQPICNSVKYSRWVVGGRVSVSTLAGLDVAIVGMGTSVGNNWVIAAEGAFEYVALMVKAAESGTNFIIKSRTNSVETVVDTGVAFSANYTEIYWVNDGLGTHYIVTVDANGTPTIAREASIHEMNFLDHYGVPFSGSRCASGTGVITFDSLFAMGGR